MFVAGCDDVTVVNPDLNYKEYVVVRAELVAGQDFDGVKFSRTEPLGQQYDSTIAAITSGVTAYLKIGGVQVIPLHHVGNGVYKASDRIPIKTDTQYELFAEVNGVGIYSKTKVPKTPQVASAYVEKDTIFQANVYTNPGEVYGAAWEIYNNGTVIDGAPDFGEIVHNDNQFSTSTIPVNTMALREQYRSSNYSNLWYVRVYAYDSAYLMFFTTRNNNQPVSDVYSQGGDQIVWNVYGTNVIGLFMGVAKSNYIKVQ